MALGDRKITDTQIATSGVVSAPDVLTGTAAQNKAIFDKLIKEAVKVQLNGVIDDLIATTGAAQIGVSAPAGLTGANVQSLINALNTAVAAHAGNAANPHATTKAQVGLGNVDNTSDANKPVSAAQQAALDLKVDKVTGKGLSTNDYDSAEKAKVSQIDNKANIADVLTKTNTTAFTPTADYHPCTKAYADNIAAASGAVTSVFGRAGAVVAQTGDYTPEQVGAAPISHTHTKNQITDFPASLPASGGDADHATNADKLANKYPIDYLQRMCAGIPAGETVNTTLTPIAVVHDDVLLPTGSYFWYVITIFYASVSATSSRMQIAIPYGADVPIYTRRYVTDVWSAWKSASPFVYNTAPTNPATGDLWVW